MYQYFLFDLDGTLTDPGIGITNFSQVLMVGDRKYDIIGANKNYIASVGVIYGYGDRMELETAGANYIVENPLEIVRFLKIR